MQEHSKYMQRCLDLATLGQDQVRTNPMVGSVIVQNNRIIGEGFHQKYGEAHAEVNAISDVKKNYTDAQKRLKESTLYVNLEPCAHFGKTPPCADLIIENKIPRVVIANVDPFAQVDGKGITLLKNAGIEVITGVLEEEAWELNKRFFCRTTQQRPYIILKWAETSNGYFAPTNESQSWISSPLAKTLSHQWRSEEDAIAVGYRTALIDNPQLNVRNAKGKNPIRVIIDKDLTLPTDLYIFDQKQKTLVFNTKRSDINQNIHYIEIPEANYYFYQKLVYQLYLTDINSIIIEGGRETLSAFIEANLWDEARIFSSKNTTWKSGIKAPYLPIHLQTHQIDLGEDRLLYFKNT